MRVRLIEVPYHAGQLRTGMGRGPERILEGGAAERLRESGADVAVESVEIAAGSWNEVGATFELNRALRGRVRAALEDGVFPLVLSGNCSSSHGTLAALGGEPAVVWFDAHADFNTPETTVSGFFDGMALAVAAGRCWSALAAALPGFAPVDERRILLVGTRDVDPGERRLLEDSRIARIPGGMPAADAEAALERALAELSDRASAAYLHVDLDVIDAREVPVNPWSSPGGFTSAELSRALTQVRRSVPVRAATLSAYDPGCDPDGRALEVALQTLVALVEPLA